VNARAWILSASLLLGCLPAAEPFRCDLAGGDRACDSVPGARCVAGYCAESVSISLCASGLRYTASARRAGECAAVDDAAVVDVTDAVVDVSAPPDLVAAVDAHDVSSSQDLPSPMDLAAADLPTPTDTSDVIDASDVVTAMDASDVVTAMDVRDVVTAMDVRDVVTAMDVPDVPDVPDAIDAVALRDAPDVIDVVNARDVTDVVDAPDVPVVPPPPVEWLSPLPNERFLSGRVPVRIVRRGNDIINVRTALGLNCDRAQTLTSLAGVSVDISTNRNYLCLRLEVGADGGVWISPWRRIVSMGRNYAQNAAAHWGRWPDFNNDGQADLLMATETVVRVFRFLNAATMESGATVPGPTTSARPVAVAAVGDVDGDGFGDAVITWNLNPGRAVHLHRGGSMGLQGPGPSLPGPPNTDLTLGERIFPIGDRDDDGRANFGVWAESHNRVRTFGMNAQGQLVEGFAYSARAPIDVFVSDADVDGDGRSDSAFTAGGQTYLSLSGQRDNIILPVQGMDDRAFGRRLAFGSDLDNDGRSEFAVLVPSLGQAVIYQWVNAQLRELMRVDVTPTQPAQLVMPGDVGSDPADDLYAFTGPNRVRLRLGNSTSDSDTSLVWTEPLGVILAGVADSDTSGRVWGPGSTVAPNGFVIYNFSGNMTVPFPVANVLTGPVIAVSP
jgi:hypothetical protein